MSERAQEQGTGAGRRWLAFAVYTLLRLVLLVAIWILIAWITPVKGLWALALALLVSGAVSLFLLDRQRDAMSIGVARFFSGINERIEASARAEDVDPPASEHRQTGADDEAVGEHEDPGSLERRDQ
jgi:Flp pilus assembly protein TadB